MREFINPRYCFEAILITREVASGVTGIGLPPLYYIESVVQHHRQKVTRRVKEENNFNIKIGPG